MGLVDLINKTEPEQAPAAPQPKSEPGDALMAKANAHNNFSPEESDYVNLFMGSKEIVQKRIEEDKGFATAILPTFEKLKGEDLAHAIIDEADKIKIDFLQRNAPEKFNGGSAATRAFLNSATFGQLTRIMGGVGQLISDRPYEEIVRDQAEQARLLSKAFPKSDIAGQAAAFLIPGSPAKALFTKFAGLGLKAGQAAGILSKITQNPGLLQKAVSSGVAAATGAAAYEGVKGTAGSDLQEVSFDRGLENSMVGGAGGFVVGGAIPVVGAAVSRAASEVAPIIARGAKAVNKSVGEVLSRVSGTDEAALRAYNRKGPVIRAASNSEASIGADLVDFLQSKRAALPERTMADKLLPQIGEVDASPMIKALEGAKSGTRPGEGALHGRFDEWVQRIKAASTDGNSKMGAEKLRDLVDDLQSVASGEFGRESNYYLTALKQAARAGRQSILDTAGKSGEVGQTYTKLMEKAAEKRQILGYIKNRLGKGDEAQARNAEGFIKNLFGPNKTLTLSRMQALDQEFGTNFVEMAKNTRFAAQLGPNGTPEILSAHKTGKSLLGLATGGALGGTPGAAIGAVASSPRAAAGVLGASDSITGFVRRMVANPKALERLANGGVSTPLEIRRVAQEISRAMIKDGPISAGSVTRIVADSPYFIGLVHGFEISERRDKKNMGQSALNKFGEQQGVAEKPQGY